MTQKIYAWIRSNKLSAIGIGIGISVLCYFIVQGSGTKSSQVQYTFTAAAKGTVISSITGSGQVSASNQVALTPKVSGQLTQLAVVAGQSIKAGAVIGRVDATDARLELENAQLAYDKLVSVDATDLQSATQAYTLAKTNAQSAITTNTSALIDAYDKLGTIYNGYFTLGHYNAGPQGMQYRNTAQAQYYAVQQTLFDWKKESQTIPTTDEALITALSHAQTVADVLMSAAQKTQDAVVYYRDSEVSSSSQADTAYSAAVSAVADVHTIQTALLAAKNTLTSTSTTLADVKNGADELDIRSQQLTLRQKQQSVDDHTIRAPFDGIIASVSAHVGDTVSTGTEIATIITKEQLAEISLNEIDAAKVVVGQKATLTFDAIDDLTLTGSVASVDMVGTVTQGVVNYTVKIALDTTDDRIKPGMTVTARIVTQSKTGVLAVPLTAVKTQNGSSYIETLAHDDSVTTLTSDATPDRVQVEIGLTGDDSVEILNGLTEGESYISRTVKSTTTTKTATAAPSILGGTSTRGAGGAGGFMR